MQEADEQSEGKTVRGAQESWSAARALVGFLHWLSVYYGIVSQVCQWFVSNHLSIDSAGVCSRLRDSSDEIYWENMLWLVRQKMVDWIWSFGQVVA